MIQHFNTFRKSIRLSGQTPVVLPKRKIFPLDQGGAYRIFVNRIFLAKDDSLMSSDYASMIEQGCVGMSEGEKKDFVAKVVENVKA